MHHALKSCQFTSSVVSKCQEFCKTNKIDPTIVENVRNFARQTEFHKNPTVNQNFYPRTIPYRSVNVEMIFCYFHLNQKMNEKIFYFCPGNIKYFRGFEPHSRTYFFPINLFFKMPDDIGYKKICKNN